MIFANLIFLYLFLPANILLYFITKNTAWRNGVLIAFSLYFYAWGEPVCVLLLLFSASADYLHGLIIEQHRGKIGARLALASSLIINLGLLIVFKYSGFLVGNFNALLGTALPVPDIALPIGISFYTFQTISYTIDVYRGTVGAQKNYFKYLMYLSMYPQLVAGPIVRYVDVAREIENRNCTYKSTSAGIGRFMVGLAKKVIIANTAGELVALYMDGDLAALSTAGAWFGIIMFTLQIYFDFSGYSDMAIGLGKIFGFNFPENFRYPYIARSVTEFWRRWHISLSSFFRDYVYIPLGGNRRHLYRNIFIVWMLTGFWHGASWNFVLWGLYFAVLLAAEKLFLLKILERIPRFFSHIYLLFIVVIGWVLFYYTDMASVGRYLQVMFGAAGSGAADAGFRTVFFNNIFFLATALVACTPVFPALRTLSERNERFGRLAGKLKYLQLPAMLLILLVCTALLVGQSYNPFLYYRF